MKATPDELPGGIRSAASIPGLASLLSKAPVGVALLDRDLRYVYVNELMASINGRPAAEHPGRTLREVVPDLADFLEPILQGVSKSGNPLLGVEVRGSTPADPATEHDWRASYYPMTAPDGSVTGIGAVVEDVTRQKDTERALRAKKQQLSLIYENVVDVLFVVDVEADGDFRFSFVNQSGLDATGLREDQMVGRRVAEVIPEPSLALVLGHYRQAIESRRPVTWDEVSDYPAGRKHGVVTMAPVFDEDGVCTQLIGTVHDVTEQKQVEEALRESRTNLQTLVESAPLAIIGVDAAGRVTSWSAGAERTFGWSAAETIGGVCPAVPPEDKETCLAVVGRLMRGESVRGLLQRLRKKDGSLITASLNAAPLRVAGAITGATMILEDVTDREAAQRALEASEARFRRIAKNAPDIIYRFRLRPTHGFEFISDAVEEVTGYTPEEHYADPDLGTRIIHPEDRPALLAMLSGAVTKGTRRNRWITKAGKTIWIEDRHAPIHDDGGAVIAIEGVARDITEQVVSREALKESERRYEALVRASAQIVWTADAQGSISEVSPSWHAFTGQALEEGRELGWLDALHPDDRARALETWKEAVAAGRVVTDEFRIRHVSGEWRWTTVRAVPLRDEDGAVKSWVGMNTDITQRRAALEQLRIKDTLIERSVVGIAYGNPERGVMYVNPEFVRMFGFDSPAEVLGAELDAFASDPKTAQAIKDATIRDGYWQGEDVARRKDGTAFHIHLTVTAIRDEAGKLELLVATMMDITERKEAEAAVNAANQRLRVLSRRLMEVQENERRALARELHDELGQALTAIKISVQSLERFADPAMISSRLGDCVTAVDRALEDTRSLSLNLRPPMLDELGLLPSLRWLADQHEQHLRVTVHVGALEERFDPAIEIACYRIAQEALNNVVKHADARNAAIRLEHRGGWLRVSVSDDGTGFDVAEAQERARGGESMGLLGMEERALLAGGAIEWHSSPDAGTEVHFRLPVTRPFEDAGG